MPRLAPAPPIAPGTVINDRYEVRQSLRKGSTDEIFQAFDRSTQQTVALKVTSYLPADADAVAVQEMHLARSVSHPNVGRVLDATPSLWGPLLVIEQLPGRTLHAYLHWKMAQGGWTADELRRLASGICAGIAAIHAQGLVHRDINPGNVMVSEERVVILSGWFGSVRRPGAPDGTPGYWSPERLRGGGSSAEDDVYALAITLWEMWTGRIPEPGYRPRATTMRSQALVDTPAGLSLDEVGQIFRGMNEDPRMRPQARHLRFCDLTQLTPAQLPRERLDPGPLRGPDRASAFTPGAQSLLITCAPHAPELVGALRTLDRQVLTLGRRGDQDLVIPEASVSDTHAVLRWQQGSWVLEDLGSLHGSFADDGYDRQTQVAIGHGGEVQVGECRLALVSFGADSMAQKRARQYLGRRDGLTGLLSREHWVKALDEDRLFSAWAEAPIAVARYALRGPDRQVSERPTILEMLALRRAAFHVASLTERLLRSLTPVVAGRAGLREFVVSMVGPTVEEARPIVDEVAAQVRALLPETLEVVATVGEPEAGPSTRARTS